MPLAVTGRFSSGIASSYGAAKYIKNVKFDVNTGEIINKHALSLDEEELREEEACDGFYCIVTSEVDMSAGDIIDAYKNLWRIEDSFSQGSKIDVLFLTVLGVLALCFGIAWTYASFVEGEPQAASMGF